MSRTPAERNKGSQWEKVEGGGYSFSLTSVSERARAAIIAAGGKVAPSEEDAPIYTTRVVLPKKTRRTADPEYLCQFRYKLPDNGPRLVTWYKMNGSRHMELVEENTREPGTPVVHQLLP